MDRLLVFKALGDSTRYAIYQELSRAEAPLATADLAARVELHPNTVRPHLERMREVGLLEMSVDGHGSVGRPQHYWSVAPNGPALGLEPSGFRLLAHLLADVAARGGLGEDDLRSIGRAQGRERRPAGPSRPGRRPGRACVQALVDQLNDLGFDPTVEHEGDLATVAFSRCPFRELAAAFPDVVCQLHRGLTEGILERVGAGEGTRRSVEVRSFGTLVDEEPCQVTLSVR
ncbi:MAG TPA: helix-turn-helix domain-containing protein [Acidimicrobiales bacterium]|nr:helix-turn-helix domain-containing protein [Acidimicrobiales bacterium]